LEAKNKRKSDNKARKKSNAWGKSIFKNLKNKRREPNHEKTKFIHAKKQNSKIFEV